jgi:hypothetical protein
MKPPRFRIAWIMVTVAIAAFEFMVIRRLVDYRTPTGDFLLVGALPMANVLAIGILVGQRRPGSRPFLLGFEAFGAMALALYMVSASSFRGVMVASYLELFLGSIKKTIGTGQPFVLTAVLISAGVVMLSLPQMVFALIGGFLSRRCRVTVTRR